MRIAALAAHAALVGALVAPGAKAEDWYPSRYGADDMLGALNQMSPEGVKQAARLVKQGKVYALGIVTGRATPAYPPRTYQIVTMSAAAPTGTNKMTGHDDLLISWVGIGTQIDGLGHLGIDHRYYNGTPGSEFLTPTGLTKFAIHSLPPIVTRGVLLDVAAHRGVERLEGGQAIGRQEIEAVARAQKTEIRSGDVVLLHTGWLGVASSDPQAFMASEPGLGVEGARFLAERGVVAVGSDGWGLEAVPAEDPEQAFPVHQTLLAKNGVYILENVRTEELARDRAHEFLFVLGAPRFEGAVQMVINPVAIR
jgi:kynurenine formamidase